MVHILVNVDHNNTEVPLNYGRQYLPLSNSSYLYHTVRNSIIIYMTTVEVKGVKFIYNWFELLETQSAFVL
jgi:hypothetical protein